METLASRIKEYRQKRGLTQAEVAEAAGISRNSYFLIEKGITKDILLQTAIGISKAISIPFNTLFDIPVNDSGNNINTVKILEEQIEIYKHESEKLKKDLEAKQDHIKLLQNEKSNLKDYLVRHFVSHYSNYIGFIEDLVTQAPNEEFKNMLQNKKRNTISFEKKIQQQFIEYELFTQNDVSAFIQEMNEMGFPLKDINEME